ncbi:hypothetical protein DM01DRAFT_128239 [Hesseltinella vesiculosa]|uniref:Uncharacterized protein n=1 Tax=Hesseltinella vesiculosa TaxID=101127 RepID=A0A1X2G841_9FUNG|nr:hypothetical protein DM01DRAFT_128239 [Hesseltinella vesiculosa]
MTAEIRAHVLRVSVSQPKWMRMPAFIACQSISTILLMSSFFGQIMYFIRMICQYITK